MSQSVVPPSPPSARAAGMVNWIGRILQKFPRRFPRLAKAYVWLADGFEEALAILYVARVTLIAALCTIGVLLLPDQSRDCFRVLVENLADWDSPKTLVRGPLFHLFIQAFLAFTLWYWGRATLEFTVGGQLHAAGQQSTLRLQAATWLPRLAGCSPMIASAWGFWSVCSGDGHRRSGLVLAGLSAMLCLLFLSLVVLRRRRGPAWARLLLSQVRVSHLGKGVLHFTWLFVLLAVGVAVVVTIRPYSAIRPNSLSMLLLGIAVWSVLANALVWLGRGMRLPLLSGSLCLGLLWSALDWNDNHRLRVLPSDASRAPAPTFDVGAWQAARREGVPGAGQGKPLPMILVAAEGGGIYAAYHTAYVLATLQDHEPAFGRRVIAISGVSGGAIGAAVYATLRAAEDEGWQHRPELRIPEKGEYGKNREATDHVLSADYLAPVVGMGVFPDFIQTFLPFPVEAFDRAKGLEATLESRLQDLFVNAPRPLALDEISRSFPGKTTPALFLNTTRVDTGSRLVLASVGLGRGAANGGAGESPERRFGFNTLETLNPGLRPSLASAAFASARFPYVTPVAFVESKLLGDPSKVRIADGGYFENSGLATVLDVLHVIRKEAKTSAGEPKPHLIVLHIGAKETRGDARSLREPGLAFGEAFSPIRTLLSTRRARGDTAAQQVKRALQEFAADGFTATYLEAFLDVEKHDIPLGWHLSRMSRQKIQEEVKASPAIEHLISLIRPEAPVSTPLPSELLPNKATL